MCLEQFSFLDVWYTIPTGLANDQSSEQRKRNLKYCDSRNYSSNINIHSRKEEARFTIFIGISIALSDRRGLANTKHITACLWTFSFNRSVSLIAIVHDLCARKSWKPSQQSSVLALVLVNGRNGLNYRTLKLY